MRRNAKASTTQSATSAVQCNPLVSLCGFLIQTLVLSQWTLLALPALLAMISSAGIPAAEAEDEDVSPAISGSLVKIITRR